MRAREERGGKKEEEEEKKIGERGRKGWADGREK